MREKSDLIEVELKFLPKNSDVEVLTLLRSLLQPGWALAKSSPRIVLDIYMDTDDLYLNRTDAPLRFRKRRKKNGWTANFKLPSKGQYDYLERREIYTTLENEEVLRYKTNDIPGQASLSAYDFIASKGNKSLRFSSQRCMLKPIVLIVSYRQMYSVRPMGFAHRGLELVHVLFDEMTAFDIRDMDIDHLVTHGELDYSTDTPYHTCGFNLVEIEADCGRNRKADKRNLFELMVEKIRSNNFTMTQRNKYQTSIDSLDITQS
ncbi:MAG: CYTH domain-containing protein [Candidatus Poribacteria bacterium]|nr:CYTH domain-containing protein [Candidatus Poribacteria bacterium]